jgi:hypothetical protein
MYRTLSNSKLRIILEVLKGYRGTKETKKTAPWLQQTKNHDYAFPDAPLRKEPGLRESTT